MRFQEFIIENYSSQQVLKYIKTVHPRGEFTIDHVVKNYPEWELDNIEISKINLPDQEGNEVSPYNQIYDIDYDHVSRITINDIKNKPVVLDANGWIIDGAHRVTAAQKLGLKSIPAYVPVIDPDQETYDQFMARQAINELGGRGELQVFKRLQNYFFKRGYGYAGEGRDQMAFESPRGTIVKVLGVGDPERQQIVKNYVKFFEQNQNNPYYPRIYSSGDFTVSGKTYFVYEMEYLTYVSNEEEVLDYIEGLMSALPRGETALAAFYKNKPLPASLPADEVAGLVKATHQLEAAIGGQAPLDLSMIENIRRRADGHLVIMDPYSL